MGINMRDIVGYIFLFVVVVIEYITFGNLSKFWGWRKRMLKK